MGNPETGRNDKDDDRCPECKKEEEIITVCKHCGHVYTEEDCTTSSWDVILFFAVLFGCLYVVGTIIIWLAQQQISHPTLVHVVCDQWEFVTSLRIW